MTDAKRERDEDAMFAAQEVGEFGQHEVLDRAHICEDMFAGKVLDHPVVRADAELLKKAEDAHKALFDFYQLCGAKFL